MKTKVNFLLNLIPNMQRNIIKKPKKNNLDEPLITWAIFLSVKTLITLIFLIMLIFRRVLSIYPKQSSLAVLKLLLISVSVI